jgi:hypothetical protein
MTPTRSASLAICADTTNREVLMEAFDIVAGKSPTIEPSASLIEWVKLHHWKERADFAHMIGVMAFLDVTDAKAVEGAFASIDRYVGNSDLIDILLDTNNSIVQKMVLLRYPSRVALGLKLSLLNHGDKEVRKAAIGSIESRNIGALKIISDAYEKEADPELRKIYEERFEMIGERKRL